MINVKLPTLLRAHAGGEPQVQVEGATLGEALATLGERYPDLVRSIRGEDGALHRHVNVYVNGEDVRFLSGLATRIESGAEVSIVPAVAGGAR